MSDLESLSDQRFEIPLDEETEELLSRSKSSLSSSRQRLVTRSVETGGYFNIQRVNRSITPFRRDYFHTLLDMNLPVYVIFVVTTLIAVNAFFAVAYYVVNEYHPFLHPRGGQPATFRDSVFFTGSIVFYTGFFKDEEIAWDKSSAATLLVVWHSLLSLFWSVFVLGSFFLKLSTGKNRGSSIIFSDKAVITTERDGSLTFAFRLCETRRHQLVDARVSVYFVDHYASRIFMRRMKLATPEGPLFLGLPCTVKHTIDRTSPLCPKSKKGNRVLDDQEVSLKEIGEFSRSKRYEVIAEVTGWEPITGNSVFAVFSYTASDDEIATGAVYKSCVHASGRGAPVVDFALMHATESQQQ